MRLLLPILGLAVGLGGPALAITYAAAGLFAQDLSHTLGLARSCGAARVRACAAGSAVDEAPTRASHRRQGRSAALDDDRRGSATRRAEAAPGRRLLDLRDAVLDGELD